MARSERCGESMPRGHTCKLRVGHKGTHASVGYWCDGCSEWRRGQPHTHGEEGLGFCFLCTVAAKRWQAKGYQGE